MKTLIDTGPLVAAVDLDDKHHQRCVRLFEELPGELLLPSTVLVEACWMINRNLGSAVHADFLETVLTELTLVELTPVDVARMAELVRTYHDLRLDPADASVIALAERLGVIRVATLDRRDFTVVRPRHCAALTLFP